MAHVNDLFPPDYATGVGQVRLLIPDTEPLLDPSGVHDHAEYIFSDAQVQAFLTLYSNNVKRAAAQAKLVLATSESLINKVIRTADYTTDGAKLGAELRAQAKQLQEEADKDDLVDSYDDSFIVVPQTVKWDNSWL
jgi:hypothetical protein